MAPKILKITKNGASSCQYCRPLCNGQKDAGSDFDSVNGSWCKILCNKVYTINSILIMDLRFFIYHIRSYKDNIGITMAHKSIVHFVFDMSRIPLCKSTLLSSPTPHRLKLSLDLRIVYLWPSSENLESFINLLEVLVYASIASCTSS